MNSKKSKSGSNQDLYRICPSQLTKHELEDLYFTVLETNIQLRKTINEQQEKIKTLSKITQTKTSAMKVLQAEDRNNCCVFTNIKVKQQKECLDHLKRAHEKTAERLRKLNTQMCSTNQNSRFSPYCAQNTKSIKNTASTIKHQGNLAQSDAKPEGTHKTSTIQHQCYLTHQDAETYEKDQKLFHSVGTQTELPRDASLQHTYTQTEQLKNERLRSADTQTNPPRDKLQTAEIQTELQRENAEASMKTENSSAQDNTIRNSVQTETESPQHKLSLVSDEVQTDSISKTPYKYHNMDGQENTLCDENRCRTLVDELKLKITYLVEELAQTHKKYSDRISRLEFGAQEYRRESMQGGHKRMVDGQEVSFPSGSYLNKLVNNLRDSAAYSADLELQLAKEQKKVSELATQLRFAQLQNQLAQEQQLLNTKRMLNREETEVDAEQESYSWICNCNPNCPQNQCPFRNKPSYSHECTSTRYSANNRPVSAMSSTTSKPFNFDDTSNNGTIDFYKDQGLLTTRKSQKLSDINNKQYVKNNDENKNMTNYSERILNGNNRKEIAIPHSAEPNLPENLTTSELSPGSNKNCNVDIEEKTNDRMQTVPVAGVWYTDDANYNSAEDIAAAEDMFDLKKAYEDSDYNKKKKLSINDMDDYLNPQTGTITATDNQSKDSNVDGKRISQEKADINKLNANIDANGSRNSVKANKQQFLSKKRNISDSSNTFQNRDVASPSLLLKSLKSINEEQTKTVAELRRQQNTSQKPSGKTEKALNEISNDNKESNGNIPLDTIGLMRALSTLALNRNSVQTGDQKESINNRSQTDNAKNPQTTNLNSNVNPESCNNGIVAGRYSLPEETMGLLRLVSTAHVRNNAINREKTQNTSIDAELNPKVEVPKQETGTEQEAINYGQRNVQLQSTSSENKCRYSDDSRCTFKGINEVCKGIINTEIEVKRPKGQIKRDLHAEDVENVPTKDNENERGAVMNSEETVSEASVKYPFQPDKVKLKQINNVDKKSQVEMWQEKEVRGNTVSSSAQREIATYRRNSGTLCFKTVPASKRSQLCQCDEQSFCEIGQIKGTQTGSEIDNASQNVQNCATGHIKCTLRPKNMNVQRTSTYTVMSGSTGKRPSKQSNENKFGSSNQSLTNYLNSRDETVQTKDQMRSEYICDQRNSVGNDSRKNSTALGKSAKGPMLTLKEELERCKELSSQNNLLESRLEIHNSLDTKPSEEVVAEFDAGCHLKRGMAKHSVNEHYVPRCVFVLHIGTVVLSDEAVLISRGKSLGLTWKFYDQDVMTTQMRAGRVVVFDFSTEYDTPLTDEFMNYMKHDELKILICQLNEPNKPIASCSLPLRDALLNTNRRADMSLALVAGPQIIYARQLNNVSDVLDAGDEMGVLDLWCMLRADAKFVPLINKAISRRSTPTLLSREPKISDPKRKEKQMDKTQTKESNTSDKKMPQNDEYPSLRRWGSSVLRLPSRQQSQESSDKIKLENSSEVNLQDCRRRDSSGFNRPSTVQIDHVMPRKKLTMSHGPGKIPKTKPKKSSPKTASAAVQNNFQEDPESLIVDEVFANIRTSDDMKRVMNRVNPHAETGFTDSELSSYKKLGRPPQKDLPVQKQPGPTADMSNTTFLSNVVEDQASKKTKKVDTGSTISQDLSLEPTILFPRGSLTSKRSDITDINRKYDNIAKLYAKYNAQKNEGSRSDLSKKQVKINSKRTSTVQENLKKDKLEEEEQTIDITVLWLALNEECEAMLNPRVQRVYVSYEFLGNSGADLETPVSLPKPKHYVDKCYFNFKKTFQIGKDDMTKLGEMARCRATSQVSKTDKDCIVFSVISEPPEDPLGLDICEDIGYAYLYLGDLLAYGVGSSGYTEVIPVRSLSGTSVCGVLAVRLDGLDLLRRCLELVDSQISPS